MDSYKILGQVKTTGSATIDNIVYMVPSGKQASISNISITNVSTSPQTYYLSFVKNGESAGNLSSNFQKAIISRSIAVGETHEINGGIGLQQGDQIRLNTTSISLVVHTYGVELS